MTGADSYYSGICPRDSRDRARVVATSGSSTASRPLIQDAIEDLPDGIFRRASPTLNVIISNLKLET